MLIVGHIGFAGPAARGCLVYVVHSAAQQLVQARHLDGGPVLAAVGPGWTRKDFCVSVCVPGRVVPQ